MKKRALLCLFAVCTLWMMSASVASATDPRDAIPAPAGTNILLYYYSYYSGNEVYAQGNLVDVNTPAKIHSNIFRYGYYGSLGSKIWHASVLLPFGDKSVDGTAVGNAEQGASGMGDFTVCFGYWPIINREEKHYLVGVMYVTAPTGDYRNNKSVNMGDNVWKFKPEIGWIKGFGPFYLQLVAGATFQTDNDQYTVLNKTRSRDPLYHGEAHLSYTISPDLWVAGSWYYKNGGENEIEGRAASNDKQNDHTLGISLNYRLTKNLSALIGYKNAVQTENGQSIDETVRFKLTYAW